jgi:hypothetical protein
MVREDDGSQRDELAQAQPHRRARGRTRLLCRLREGFRGGPSRPQRLILVTEALILAAQLVVTRATRLLTCYGVLDSAALLVHRLTAAPHFRRTLSNRTPVSPSNRCCIANPRGDRETKHRREPRLIATIANTPRKTHFGYTRQIVNLDFAKNTPS